MQADRWYLVEQGQLRKCLVSGKIPGLARGGGTRWPLASKFSPQNRTPTDNSLITVGRGRNVVFLVLTDKAY